MDNIMRELSRLFVLLIFCMSQSGHAASAKEPAMQELAGHYYLHGATETGSELVLRKSGKFDWMMVYGNREYAAEGEWRSNGRHVTLFTSPPAAFRLFTEDELDVKKPLKEGIWVAIVGVPRQGPAAGVEVQFEATSGKVATAVSNAKGSAIVTMPVSERWARAGLRRAGSEQWQWFSVPPERALARFAGFALPNLYSHQPALFKTLKLRKEKGKLVIDDEVVQIGGAYEKYSR
jgi:hypothetical protein